VDVFEPTEDLVDEILDMFGGERLFGIDDPVKICFHEILRGVCERRERWRRMIMMMMMMMMMMMRRRRGDSPERYKYLQNRLPQGKEDRDREFG
jgi:hypothetical protein